MQLRVCSRRAKEKARDGEQRWIDQGGTIRHECLRRYTSSPCMGTREHLDVLSLGVSPWNEWRRENIGIVPDLSGADLNGANLSMADLSGANLINAKLNEAELSRANLRRANVFRADLSKANLNWAR